MIRAIPSSRARTRVLSNRTPGRSRPSAMAERIAVRSADVAARPRLVGGGGQALGGDGARVLGPIEMPIVGPCDPTSHGPSMPVYAGAHHPVAPPPHGGGGEPPCRRCRVRTTGEVSPSRAWRRRRQRPRPRTPRVDPGAAIDPQLTRLARCRTGPSSGKAPCDDRRHRATVRDGRDGDRYLGHRRRPVDACPDRPGTNAIVSQTPMDGSACGIAVGSDGRVWVALLSVGRVVAIDPATGAVDATVGGLGSQLWDLKVGRCDLGGRSIAS